MTTIEWRIVKLNLTLTNKKNSFILGPTIWLSSFWHHRFSPRSFWPQVFLASIQFDFVDFGSRDGFLAPYIFALFILTSVSFALVFIEVNDTSMQKNH